MTIVVTAATTWEERPLARALGRLEGADLRLVRTGIGPERTLKALAGLPTPGDLVAISSGLAGALQPGIASGDLVADLRGAPVELVSAAREEAAGLGIPIHFGVIHASDRVVVDPARKRALGESLRAVAVDMESGAVRSWCEGRGGQFLAVRAVIDELDQCLPDWPAEDESPALLARQALSHWAQIPSLLALAWRTRRAMAALSSFMRGWLPHVPRQFSPSTLASPRESRPRLAT